MTAILLSVSSVTATSQAGSSSDSTSNSPAPEAPPIRPRQGVLEMCKDIAGQISRGETTLVTMQSLKPNVKLNLLWESFRIVKDSRGTLLEAVQCTQCKEVLTYKERANGTRNLSRHLVNCSTEVGDNPCRDNGMIDPPHGAKVQFTAASVKYCTLGLRAPESLADSGMLILMQKALDLQYAYAKYGRIDASKLIPHPTTVADHIKKEAEKAMKATVEDVLPFIQKKRCAGVRPLQKDGRRTFAAALSTIDSSLRPQLDTEKPTLVRFPLARRSTFHR